MAKFWTAVVFYMCGCTVDVYGTTDEDALPTSLARTVTSTTLPTVLPTEDESIKLVDWLTKYGYLPPPDPSTGQLQAWTAVTQAVKKMQRFAGLNDTGVLDEQTVQLMQTPRCSLPDDDDDDDQTIQVSALHGDMENQRMKRAVSTWTRRNINWRLRSYPSSSKLPREMIRSLVYYALRVWADPTLLEFHEVRGPEGADLQIDFLHGPHGDGYPFDGAGGSVGHAFFPSDPDRAGGVHPSSHFSGQNMWRVSRGGLVSVRAVPVQRLWSALPSSLPPLQAVLERHTDHAIIFVSSSQVWLFKDLSLQEGFPQPLSTPEDSEGLWQGLHWDPTQGVVWGAMREYREKRESPEESEVWRELIESGVNGIITENDDENVGDFKGPTYIFKGNSYWKFTHPGSAPEEGYPRLLATDWLDCPRPSSYSPGDISLISHYGQQELHEQEGQRIIDQIRHKEKTRDKPHRWDCPCLNSAVTQIGPILLLPILFLITVIC